jgi:serine/threonine-protein kinase
MSHHHTEASELDSIAALLPAFDLEGLIAHGASGAVFKARQRSLDREVAIRIVPRDLANDPAFRESFNTMARAMANLAHPSLIRVYDSGEVAGMLFMVMEYVPGKSLRHSARGKAIEPRQAVQIVAAACHGLAHAHTNGLSNGAVHPANILLTPKCEPKIGNFRSTRGGHNMDLGPDAAAYMAPEIANGGSSVTPLADVYSLGVLLGELLTGIPAAPGSTASAAIQDPTLAAICQKAAHSDPASRYSDAADLAADLDRWSAPAATVRSKLQTPTSSYRPKAPATSKAPEVSCPGTRPGRGMLVHCTIIAALLLAIHGVWGAYQAKQESLARLRSMEESKPRMIVIQARPSIEKGQTIDSSLVQLKP